MSASQASVSLPQLHTGDPRSLSSKLITLWRNSSKNLTLRGTFWSTGLGLEMSLLKDGGRDGRLDTLAADCGCVGNGDQSELIESAVVAETALPGESAIDNTSPPWKSLIVLHLSDPKL